MTVSKFLQHFRKPCRPRACSGGPAWALTGKRVRQSLVLMVWGGAALPALAAQVVEIEWPQGGGPFELNTVIHPKGIVEACGVIAGGSTINWLFRAEGALDFNIHHHVGKLVKYSERKVAVTTAAGQFAPTSAQQYCWMWKNTSTQASTLKVALTLNPP